jgi:hypothetical protein
MGSHIFMSKLFLFVSALSMFSSVAMPCGEIGKFIKLSGTSFEKETDIFYHTGNGLRLTIRSLAGKRWAFFSNPKDRRETCLEVTDKDQSNVKCGSELNAIPFSDREILDRDRNPVGMLVFDGKYFTIQRNLLPGDRPGARGPHLRFDIVEADRLWNVSAFEDASQKVGGGEMRSAGLNPLGNPMGNGPTMREDRASSAVDLRGNEFKTIGHGCESSLETKKLASPLPTVSAPESQAPKVPRAKPKFEMETEAAR